MPTPSSVSVSTTMAQYPSMSPPSVSSSAGRASALGNTCVSAQMVLSTQCFSKTIRVDGVKRPVANVTLVMAYATASPRPITHRCFAIQRAVSFRYVSRRTTSAAASSTA